MENEISEGLIQFAEAYEAVDELAAARQPQARFQDELKTRKTSTLPSGNSTTAGLLVLQRLVTWGDASKRTIELKRKADDAHDRTRSLRERCRRATEDHVMAVRGGSQQQPGMSG